MIYSIMHVLNEKKRYKLKMHVANMLKFHNNNDNGTKINNISR